MTISGQFTYKRAYLFNKFQVKSMILLHSVLQYTDTGQAQGSLFLQ